MIVGTPITIEDKEYIIRFPIGALILAEKKLGWKLVTLQDRAKDNNLSFEDMATITKYGLHNPDGTPVSDTQFNVILDSVGMIEFAKIFEKVGYALSGTVAPDESGKNN